MAYDPSQSYGAKQFGGEWWLPVQNQQRGVMDSHSGTRLMPTMYAPAPQPTPKQVVPSVPQPTPTTSAAYQRELATQNYANEPMPGQNNLASILAGLFGFMK